MTFRPDPPPNLPIETEEATVAAPDTQIVKSQIVTVGSGFETIAMTRLPAINNSKLLSIPLEIREKIWAYVFERPETFLLDTNEDRRLWTTEKVSRQEYNEMYPGLQCHNPLHPRITIAADNPAVNIAKMQAVTLRLVNISVAAIVLDVSALLGILWRSGRNTMDNFQLILAAFSVFTTLLVFPLAWTLVRHRRSPNIQLYLYAAALAADLMAKTISSVRRQFSSANKLPTCSDHTTSLLLVSTQINREAYIAYQRSHCYALSFTAMRKLCSGEPEMSLQQRKNVHSIIIPPIVANNRAEVQEWRTTFCRLTRALPHVRSVEIRITFLQSIQMTAAGPSFRAFEEVERNGNGLRLISTSGRVTWRPSFFDPLRAWNLRHATVSVRPSDIAAWNLPAALEKANLKGARFARNIQKAVLCEKVWRQHLSAEQEAVSKQISDIITEG